MTLFVDASALVAIVNGEVEAPSLDERLAADPERLTSAIAVWEATMAVARTVRNDLAKAADQVEQILAAAQLRIVPIGADEAAEALRAHMRYGKGTGHPARLNMGDCFAYACAKTNNARLLYKGDDFAQTDLR